MIKVKNTELERELHTFDAKPQTRPVTSWGASSIGVTGGGRPLLIHQEPTSKD